MKRHRYQTKGEVTPLSRGSKSFYNRNLPALPYASTPHAADQAENIKAIGREQEVERFAKDLFAKQRKPAVDRMQEYRDDPTNPLAYAPLTGEALDLMSVGHHLEKGNYGQAAMYGAGFMLPIVPGAAVKKVAGPVVDKVKPYIKGAANLNRSNELQKLWRIQEKGAKPTAQLAKEGKLGKHFQNEQSIKHFNDREKHFGEWFTNDKKDLDWYTKDREFLNPEIIELNVPKSKLKNYQNYDKSLSRASDREFVIPLSEQKNYYANGGPIPNYRDGGETDPPVKYISDPEEFKVREQAYNDSLYAYNNLNWGGNGVGSRDKVYREAMLSQTADWKARKAAGVLNPRDSTRLADMKEDDFRAGRVGFKSYKGIQPYEGMYFFIGPDSRWNNRSNVGTHTYYYKKPTQPVEYSEKKSVMAKPISGFEKKPEWAKFNSTMDRIQQYEKPIGSKKGSYATKIQGVQGLEYRDGGETDPPIGPTGPEGAPPTGVATMNARSLPKTSYQTKGTVTEEEYLAMSPQQRSVLNKNIIKSSSGAYDPDSDLLKSLREAEQMAQQNQADSSRVHNLYSELNEMVPGTTYPRGTTTGSSFAGLSPLSSYETYAPWELSELKAKRKDFRSKIGRDMEGMSSMHEEDLPKGWTGTQPLRSKLSADNDKVAFTDVSLAKRDIQKVRQGGIKNPGGFIDTAAEYARLSKNAIKDKLDGNYNYSDVYFDTYNANRYKPHGRVAPELLLPPTTVPFITPPIPPTDPYPTEKITPRGANNLADYFKGAKLATVDTKLQPIQSNWRPKSAGYTSNTAGGYPMMKKDGSTGRVPLGAQFVPGKGYKYTND